MNLGITNSQDLDQGKATYENLVKHVDRFGLDNEPKGRLAGRPKVYTSYKQFRTDSAIEVARSYLAEDSYVAFVTRYGEGKWADEARADWQAEERA